MHSGSLDILTEEFYNFRICLGLQVVEVFFLGYADTAVKHTHTISFTLSHLG